MENEIMQSIPVQKTCNRKPEPSARRRMFKIQRICIFIVWTVLFAYYSVNAEDVFTSGNSTQNPKNLFNQVPVESSNEQKSLEPPVESPFVNIQNETSGTYVNGTYASSEVPGHNCTPPGIDEFPPDLFTQSQRRSGWVIVHFLISLYIFYGIASVCDDYFVPSIERICEELKIPSDVAGATLMAVATSAPELFTNVIGTFVTKGDIGIGTIVGSAVFNILVVAAVCGLGAGMVVPLEWWSVTRDSFCYWISIVLLIIFVRDEKIYWYEALILLSVYVLYILAMYKNSTLKHKAERLVFKVETQFRRNDNKIDTTYTTKASDTSVVDTQMNGYGNGNGIEGGDTDSERRDEFLVEQAVKYSQDAAEEKIDDSGLCVLPYGEGFKAWVEFVLSWPVILLLTVTIPDCRVIRWKKWYGVTFVMCILWIGTLSYIVTWMISVIGHTLKIPDSVMGLTFIAAGSSVPEVVSSLIVARQGLGTMAISNSIGSNTFDILMCLGIPWLIKASLNAEDTINYVQINSTGFGYSTIMLIISLVVLYLILALNNFVLDRKVGFLALTLYAVFLIMASLLELNVFFTVNLPTCQYED